MNFQIKKTVGVLLILLLVVNSLFIPQPKAAINEQIIHNYPENTWAFNNLAEGPNGEIYLTHKVSSTEIAIKKWNGSGWTPYTNFTPPMAGVDSFSDDLDLVVDASGHLHLAFRFERGSGILSYRGVEYGYFNGSAWTFEIIEGASDPSGWKNYDDPSIAVDSNGKVHLVYKYEDSNGSRIYSARYATNFSGTWVTSELVRGTGTIGIDEIHDPQIKN